MNKKDLETFFNQGKIFHGVLYMPIRVAKWTDIDGTESIEIFAEYKGEVSQTVWLPFEKWITLENDSR